MHDNELTVEQRVGNSIYSKSSEKQSSEAHAGARITTTEAATKTAAAVLEGHLELVQLIPGVPGHDDGGR